MPGVKEFNVDLDVRGKITLKDIPNNTPTGFLVWNSGIKDIAQRTPAQIISDLGLITASNIASSYYSKTESDNKFVPYTGATKNVNLGANNLSFTEGSISKLSNSVQVFKNVYQKNGIASTGILSLSFPPPNSGATMFDVTIRIYGYNAKILGEIRVSFYKYTSTVINASGHKCIITSSDNFPTEVVKVGINSDGKICINIGELTTSWSSHTNVRVDEVTATYNGYGSDWSQGWDSSTPDQTELDGYSSLLAIPVEVVASKSWSNLTYEPKFTKSTAFNKNFGTVAGTVAQGSDSRINNGQTAFGWGNHSTAGYLTSSALTPYAQTSWVNANFDKYTSWNLKTNGVQRTTIKSGETLDLVGGENVSLSYGAGGVIIINASNTIDLEQVMQRGNSSTKSLIFNPSEGIGGQLYFNKNTYSYYFGNMNPNHTGTYNQSYGYNALAKLTSGDGNNAFGFNALGELTTGYQNAAFGTGAGGKITSGTFNTAFGFAALGKTTTGYKNNAFGYESGHNNTTGKLNNFLGSSAGQGNSTGSLNNYIGVFSGQGVNGNNNVMIGTGAGVNGGNVNNKLVIHGNTTLSGFGSAPNEYGTFGNINESNLSNALIVGDFLEKWVKFNGSFSINPAYLPDANANPLYLWEVVLKADGTFGYQKRKNGNFLFSEVNTGENWHDGKDIHRKFISITIPANAVTDSPFSIPITEAGEIISFEKCFMKVSGVNRKIGPSNQEGTISYWYFDIMDLNSLRVIIGISSPLERIISGVVEYTKSAL